MRHLFFYEISLEYFSFFLMTSELLFRYTGISNHFLYHKSIFMFKAITLATLLFTFFSLGCKKEKAGGESGSKEAKISTVELKAVRSTTVYGSDITFKVRFEDTGKGDKVVDEYGILFKAWIADLDNKIPTNGSGTIILFHDTPAAGSIIDKEVTLTFEQFNDANYRAFARLKDGSYVYGEVMYFASA